jgi:hypothetical protein
MTASTMPADAAWLGDAARLVDLPVSNSVACIDLDVTSKL